MPAAIFYPYQVAANEIDLGLSGLHGTVLAGYGENSQIIEEPPPTVIHICASISLDISIYSSVLDPDELDDPPVSIYLIGKSRGSRKTVVRNAGAGDRCRQRHRATSTRTRRVVSRHSWNHPSFLRRPARRSTGRGQHRRARRCRAARRPLRPLAPAETIADHRCRSYP